MTLAVEENIAFNPVHVSLFGANTIVLHAQLIAYLIKQPGRFCSGAFIRQIRGYHNFALNQFMALHHGCRIIHPEGAFAGAF
jgi:hypothetical protein